MISECNYNYETWHDAWEGIDDGTNCSVYGDDEWCTADGEKGETRVFNSL